jgi:hypothetical protein
MMISIHPEIVRTSRRIRVKLIVPTPNTLEMDSIPLVIIGEHILFFRRHSSAIQSRANHYGCPTSDSGGGIRKRNVIDAAKHRVDFRGYVRDTGVENRGVNIASRWGIIC